MCNSLLTHLTIQLTSSQIYAGTHSTIRFAYIRRRFIKIAHLYPSYTKDLPSYTKEPIFLPIKVKSHLLPNFISSEQKTGTKP